MCGSVSVVLCAMWSVGLAAGPDKKPAIHIWLHDLSFLPSEVSDPMDGDGNNGTQPQLTPKC